jgi:CheY-like chemotaxis protein
MSRSNPVPVRCTLPDGAIFDVVADEIGRGGLTFYMSDSPTQLSVNQSLAFDFDTPGLDGIKASGSIRDSSRILDMLCFGVRFSDVSEGGQPKLTEYQRTKEDQFGPDAAINSGSEQGVVFIVDQPQAQDSYGFLDQHFNVVRSDSFGVIDRLLAALPEAILFNSGLQDSAMVLQVLTNHPVLRQTPIIEIQTKKRRISHKLFATIPFPLDEGLVVETLYRAVTADKISRILRQGDFSGPFKTGVSILLVDDSSASEVCDLETIRCLNCDVRRIVDLKLLYDSFVWSTPDVIAIDESTREVDARTVCRLLNMNRELKDVPKLLLSRKRGCEDQDRSNLFSSVLTKPFTPKQLLSRVHYLMSQASH